MTESPRIGLALGGGGARGIAHIAMLEVFDELGIRPAMIAGSSMGALVGAIYAAGMPAAEIRAHVGRLLTNRVDFVRHVFGKRQTRITELVSMAGLSQLHLEGRKLVELALPDQLPQRIEETRIPLKVIAADYENMEEVVFTQGPIAEAVGASIAIPGVIAAPRINGRILVDGGIVNPVPFNHVSEGMDLVVAVDVTGRPRPVANGRVGNPELAIGSLLIMFNKLAEMRRAANPPDIYVRPDVNGFGTGDFFRAPDILKASEPAKAQLRQSLLLRLGKAPAP